MATRLRSLRNAIATAMTGNELNLNFFCASTSLVTRHHLADDLVARYLIVSPRILNLNAPTPPAGGLHSLLSGQV